MRDYIGALFKTDEDAEQHGIMGMRWGRRRTDAQLANDTKARAASGEKVTPTAKAKAAVAGAPKPESEGHVETSAQRYHRLGAVAKGGGANTLSDQDLKFYNARSEALNKINKMNQTSPSWIKETAKQVLQSAAQRQMQTLANGVADKYVSAPVLASLKKAGDTAEGAKVVAATAAKTLPKKN